MELEEFKKLWKAKSEIDSLETNIKAEKINSIIMKTTSTLGKIRSTNDFWYKLIIKIFYLFLGLGSLNIAMHWLFPEKFKNLGETLIYYSILVVFFLLSIITYRLQKKVFESSGQENLVLDIKTYIKRFNNYYIVIIAAWTPVIFFVLYMSTIWVLNAFKIQLSTFNNVVVSLAVILVALIINHIYYRKTYFTWIDSLKINLKDLQEEK